MASHGFPSCVLNFLGIFSENHLRAVNSFCESLIGTSMLDKSCCCHVIGQLFLEIFRRPPIKCKRFLGNGANGSSGVKFSSLAVRNTDVLERERGSSHLGPVHQTRSKCTHKTQRIHERNSIHGGWRRISREHKRRCWRLMRAGDASSLVRVPVNHLDGCRRPAGKLHANSTDIAKHPTRNDYFGIAAF